jgi:hypothetical protein
VEEVCGRIDAEIQRRLASDKGDNANELYYQAVVAFRWRSMFRPELPVISNVEDDEAPGDSEGEDASMALVVMRKVFAFALDVSPRNF